MHPFYILLGLFAIFGLVVLVVMLRWERRKFIHMGKGTAWFPVRIATLPILFVLTVMIAIPTRSISGMEALGVFYLMLFTVAPVFWFGAHWLVGKFVQPVLTFRESAQIAALPLLLVIALAWLAQTLQPLAWSLLRIMGIEA